LIKPVKQKLEMLKQEKKELIEEIPMLQKRINELEKELDLKLTVFKAEKAENKD